MFSPRLGTGWSAAGGCTGSGICVGFGLAGAERAPVTNAPGTGFDGVACVASMGASAIGVRTAVGAGGASNAGAAGGATAVVGGRSPLDGSEGDRRARQATAVPRATVTNAPRMVASRVLDGAHVPACELAHVDDVVCSGWAAFAEASGGGGAEAQRTREIRSTDISLRGGPNGASAEASLATFA
jgi:hypothetical protein